MKDHQPVINLECFQPYMSPSYILSFGFDKKSQTNIRHSNSNLVYFRMHICLHGMTLWFWAMGKKFLLLHLTYILSIGYSDAWVCREPLTELTMYFTVYLFLSHSMTAGLQKQYVFSSIILCVYIFCVLFCVSYF